MIDKERTFLERVSLLITELKAPKSQRNNFGKYNYRSAEDILEAVKPLANNYGLVPKLSDEPVMIGDWHYIKATASIAGVVLGVSSNNYNSQDYGDGQEFTERKDD